MTNVLGTSSSWKKCILKSEIEAKFWFGKYQHKNCIYYIKKVLLMNVVCAPNSYGPCDMVNLVRKQTHVHTVQCTVQRNSVKVLNSKKDNS